MQRAHGIGLLSGGLDSALAARVVHAAGADVTCLHFVTGFCVTAHHSRLGRSDRALGNPALRVGAHNGIRVELVDVSDDYLSMVLAPRHGYGAHMNPCIDCRLFMLRRAARYMEEVGADFVFTGEVVGQRPFSQRREAMDLIERESGLEGRLLRPLCAHYLPPTRVELAGRLDRSRLHRMSGRGRSAQLSLAKRLGVTGFASPAGGCCFLADPGYSKRLKDLVAHERPERLTMDDVYLLGVGRHFRLSTRTKLIVARNATEDKFLKPYGSQRWSARAVEATGPTGIATGALDEGDFPRVAAIVARYGQARAADSVRVEMRRGSEARVLSVRPAPEDLLQGLRI